MNRDGRRVMVAGAAMVVTALGWAPAFAHHPMGGVVPTTAWHGVISGLAHPIIGIDHLAFLIGAALLAAWSGVRSVFGAGLVLLFALAVAGGTWLRATGWNFALVEFGVAASLMLLALLARLPAQPGRGAWPALAIAAGAAHGLAFGEAVVGAEASPLLSYLVGLALIQAALTGSAFGVGRAIQRSRPHALSASRRLLGGAAAAAGVWALVVSTA